jgi:hypothetical protein
MFAEKAPKMHCGENSAAPPEPISSNALVLGLNYVPDLRNLSSGHCAATLVSTEAQERKGLGLLKSFSQALCLFQGAITAHQLHCAARFS